MPLFFSIHLTNKFLTDTHLSDLTNYTDQVLKVADSRGSSLVLLVNRVFIMCTVHYYPFVAPMK